MMQTSTVVQSASPAPTVLREEDQKRGKKEKPIEKAKATNVDPDLYAILSLKATIFPTASQ